MPVQRPHLVVPSLGDRYKFSVKGGGGSSSHPPEVDRARRAEARDEVLRQLEQVIAAAQADQDIDSTRIPMSVRATIDWGVAKTIPGRRNDVLSTIGFNGKSRLNIALDADTLQSFQNSGDKYVSYVDGERRPPNFDFFEAQPKLVISEVQDLWGSSFPIPDDHAEVLWEVWVQRSSEPRFREALEELGLAARRAMRFGQLRVIAVEATKLQFDELVRSGSISQLKPASNLNSDLVSVPRGVQQAAVTAASGRITPASATAPAVCLLDTGIRRDHPLLAASIDLATTVTHGDGNDWSGHGTKMAGLALFEDLPGLVLLNGSEDLAIRLESVVIQPPVGLIDDKLPAERLTMAVNLVEEKTTRPRTFCLAMSATEEGSAGGVATLSSEVDRLSQESGAERLFCVPAGNLDINTVFGDYQVLNEVSGLVTPAQAWNALTVAACTYLDQVPATHSSLAPAGDLSPWSRTAVAWERDHKPPMKPDVVYEGGNQMYDQVSQDLSQHADLCLLTTDADLTNPLTLTGMTSAATASVSGLCGRLQAEYPDLWPETIRGLVVHSCEHTEAMVIRAEEALAA